MTSSIPPLEHPPRSLFDALVRRWPPPLPSLPIGLGLQGYSAQELKPMREFSDIVVMPWQGITPPLYRGGPIWPNWEHQVEIRHGRRGCPIDEIPERQPVVRALDYPVVWGGQSYHHFGHQIADHSTRILQSVVERPTDPFLFLRNPANPAPELFYAVMSWLGLSRSQIQFVDEPVKASRLHVAAQAEQLPNLGPCEAYLELLDRNWRNKHLEPVRSRVVYVSRANMTTKGCHAGEEYLCSVLAKLGVTVIKPELMPLEEQMRHYAGAEKLVFAEGSALHGRQLLGRLDQEIVVLNRRPRARIGWASLMPRCRHLAYAETSLEPVATYWKNGLMHDGRAISIYDIEVLFSAFRSVQVKLAQNWRQDQYSRSRDKAIRRWLTVQLRNPDIDLDHSVRSIEKRLRETDMQHLIRFVQTRSEAAALPDQELQG